jgi:hypothetical protein
METLSDKDLIFYAAAGLIIAFCVYPATKPLFGQNNGIRLVATLAIVGLCLIGIDRSAIRFVEDHYGALAVTLLVSVATFVGLYWRARLRKRQGGGDDE